MASIEKVATVPYIRQKARSLRDYLRWTPLCRDLRVATMDADLIVMGAYRRQLLRGIFIGTTVERVIRTGNAMRLNSMQSRPWVLTARSA